MKPKIFSLRWIRQSLAPLSGLFLTLGSSSILAEEKNVLIFFIDDLRPELGCYGVDSIKSPHVDKLAAEGVLFERAYCQQGICAPSRISMMTGLYPDTTGIYDLWTPVRKAIPDVMSLPRYFGERGYHTASFGKVYHHRIDDRESWSELPERPGLLFADPEVLASIEKRKKEAREKGLTKVALSSATKGPPVEMAEVEDEVYQDGAVAQQAIRSLRENKDKPFFMCIGFAKPHLPFAAPKKYWDLYQREQFKAPKRELPTGAPALAFTKFGELRSYLGMPKEGPLTDEQTCELMHGYAASVSFADAQVGKVMAELESLGLRENTVVVLWGDHGYKLGEYGLWCKHTNLELDTRVPFLISAPGFPTGQRSLSFVEMVDIFPTVARLSGGEIPPSCEGANLATVLKDVAHQVRPYAFSQYPRGSKIGYTMRNERWRYTEWIDAKTQEIAIRELYDHQLSSVSHQNLAGLAEHKELVADLSQQLNSKKRLQKRVERSSK
jgi:iduronate 2-sulfatase